MNACQVSIACQETNLQYSAVDAKVGDSCSAKAVTVTSEHPVWTELMLPAVVNCPGSSCGRYVPLPAAAPVLLLLS